MIEVWSPCRAGSSAFSQARSALLLYLRSMLATPRAPSGRASRQAARSGMRSADSSQEVEPDGCHLWAAVRHDGGEIGECLLRGDEIEELGRDSASGGDVLGRMATTRGCSLDYVMAYHSAFAFFGGLPGPRRFLFLERGGRPGPRRMRVFDPGGRPGPLRLPRRLRPFLAFFFGPALPNSQWIACWTSSRTRLRTMLTKLVGRGMGPPCQVPMSRDFPVHQGIKEQLPQASDGRSNG
jgi:hypothetical protein